MLWRADLGDGTYKNPIIYGDYSDPDAIRVGNDYYMVASSFSNAPAIPILHSCDLVNWKVINYVCRNVPEYRYINPMHGSGVWAPAIRFHAGEYYVYFPMPDEGIYVSKAKDPCGEWSRPVNIMPEFGVIDPCPFWDDDGRAYLATAVSGARVGYKSVLRLAEMSADGMKLLTESEIIYDGRNTENETIEGPKLYKRNGWYYIFSPAGGVKCGFQVALRSRSINGPYESRVVMRQGASQVNGPHQGAWVDTVTGEDWFIHFQDVYAGGRIVHLQPMCWEEDWPVIGAKCEGKEYGEPVVTYRKPKVADDVLSDAANKVYEPDNSDEFESETLGLQWQWNANYEDDWFKIVPEQSKLILYAVKTNNMRQLSDFRNLLLQKWPAPEFVCETKMNIRNLNINDMAGIVSMGQIFGGLAVRVKADESEELKYELVKITGAQEFDHNAAFAESDECVAELDSELIKAADYDIRFHYQVKIREYIDRLDRRDWQDNEIWVRHIPQEDIFMYMEIAGEIVAGSKMRINAKAGRWVGVKNGVFCVHKGTGGEFGYAEIDYVRYREIEHDI